MLCLARAEGLGPSFGMKGGGGPAGGYAQVVPMEDINPAFHRRLPPPITSAKQPAGRAARQPHLLGQCPSTSTSGRVTWRRVMDMNDRRGCARSSLRSAASPMAFPARGRLFDITVASEVDGDSSALAKDLEDLKTRLGNIVVAYTARPQGRVARRATSRAHGGHGGRCFKDAAPRPNLVQTRLEGTPAFIHGGPFANIAHGCNSVVATTDGAQSSPTNVVTEAGLSAADLGAEKFIDHQVPQRPALAPGLCGDRRDPISRPQDAWRRERKEDLKAEETSTGASRPAMANLQRHVEERAEVRPSRGGLDQPLLSADTDAEDRAGQGESCKSLGVEGR